ncbi:hypothetical protein CYLTODRAFT_106106 [Cylindrobasidium torrendii FP15055 ss-10]|uniref:Uncharacterized protein n=1 Tax=Cylindrobasidium torrendii FP15055 ss-10 TaxID=1314674 RepID=A0A0D7B2F2_9AGAR|nr:hypothetical protein CYLTODRAFT_106106 [Cylindrobasidium torrendii FP15055 ss-10]
MILVLATGDVDHLIRDSNNSTGWYTKFEFNTVLAHSNAPAPSAGVSSASAAVPTAGIGADSVVSGGNVRRSRLVEGYVQVIGCTLCIEEMQVAITERGFLAEDSTPTHPAPHPWEDFEWQETSEESIERQFLITWTPSTGLSERELVSGAPMERLLRQQTFVNDTDGDNSVDGAMRLPITLDIFEDRLERLTSTYLYSYWRKCQGPLMMFAFDCANFHDHDEAESVKQYAAWATFTGYGKEARLEIQGYRAVIAFVASLVMGVLACCLLRVRTEAKPGEEVMDWNVLDGVRLMRGSSLPMIAGDEGPEGVRIRYRPAGDGIFANLDHHEEYEKVP